MAKVKIAKREDFDRALRKFKTECKREGILKEFRERQFYIKPSQKRRTKASKRKR